MAFLAICALSGVALGADLALPSAMLAGVVQSKASADTGAYFGWWAFATKLNLALAAGLALPLLSLWGYQPDSRETQALAALSMAYCLLPCALKASAAACLYFFIIRKPESLYDRSLPP
jgi:Na+/melibiose symporter-like transporter